jgi:hypothetical protein
MACAVMRRCFRCLLQPFVASSFSDFFHTLRYSGGVITDSVARAMIVGHRGALPRNLNIVVPYHMCFDDPTTDCNSNSLMYPTWNIFE